MPNARPLPHVLQSDFISVLYNGKPYPVSKGQATFKTLYRAIQKAQWDKVPRLLSLSSQLAEKTHGKVTVKAEGVAYKGQVVHNVLTAKIMELLEHSRPVSHLLRFMDNLFLNPDAETVNEIYEWLSSGRFALTDDGCFLAYKKVRGDFKDIHTGKFDNRPGRVITIPREACDPDRRNECSRGLHFCSRSYLPQFGATWAPGASRIVEVKVNPADVVAIPVGYGNAKGRTWRYEVLREVGYDEMIEGVTDSPVMMQPVIELAGDRVGLIRQVKALPSVKRLIRRGQMTPETFSKASTERLTGWLRKFASMDIAPEKSKLFNNPLRFAREAAGKSLGEVAKASGLTLQEVYNAERCLHPEQVVIDQLLTAIAALQGRTYPKGASEYEGYTATAYATEYDDEDEDDMSDYYDEDDDDL